MLDNTTEELFAIPLEEPVFSREASTVAAVAAATCSILGIVGNCMVLIAVGFGPSKELKRHPIIPLFISLAISDLIFSTFNLPITSARFFTRGPVLGPLLCRLFPFLYYSNVLVSVFSTMLIALFRLIGINFPNAAKDLITWRRAWLAVIIVWAEAFFLLAFPLFSIWGTVGYVSRTFSCTILPDPSSGRNPTVFLVVVGTAVPFAATVVSYLLVCLKVKRTGRRMRHSVRHDEPRLSWRLRQSSVTRATLDRERQLTRTVFLVCASFALCFAPSEIVALLDPMPPNYDHANAHIACYVLFWCSAFLNPFIYIASSQQFRQELRCVADKLFHKGRRREEASTSGVTTVWYVMPKRMEEEEEEKMLPAAAQIYCQREEKKSEEGEIRQDDIGVQNVVCGPGC